jgi:hypothetical protein
VFSDNYYKRLESFRTLSTKLGTRMLDSVTAEDPEDPELALAEELRFPSSDSSAGRFPSDRYIPRLMASTSSLMSAWKGDALNCFYTAASATVLSAALVTIIMVCESVETETNAFLPPVF